MLPRLHLLTGDEIPLVQDGTRDDEHVRYAMHGWFAAALASQGVPWRPVRGSRAERLRAAADAVDSMTRGWTGPGGVVRTPTVREGRRPRRGTVRQQEPGA